MIGKFAILVALFGFASAGNLYGGGLGYSSLGYGSLGYGGGYGGAYGYSGLGYGSHAISPYSYSAPIVAKTVVAAPVIKTIAPISYAHAPALSSISQYSYHGSPIIKSYAAPLAYSSYGLGHSAYSPALTYGGYGHGAYGHSGYGYNGLW
ncbi:hypothetical protein MSG28_009649 [Choristoneura fumiferana]|uniref:Uncharacterized protein n=1 Tax=Choristoneura fumiferana TaxID=7141 RepID=A0ACC0JBZ7_CHOFU|nr:hypothetical protein MSG28_009649 [Choristoneura fumiferana]